MSPVRFIVSSRDLDGSELILEGDEFRHLRARRLETGAELIVTDGCGRERRGTIVRVSRGRAHVRMCAEEQNTPPSESPLHLELAQAALKSDKLDLVIEKATELGVSSIVVYTSTRCVSRPSADRLDRWRRIARSAAKQCQRTVIPAIRGPVEFEEILTVDLPNRLIFFEEARSVRLPTSTGLGNGSIVVIGPEGGFTASEVAKARAAGFQAVGLGPRVLRAETAAIVAITLCQRTWGDL